MFMLFRVVSWQIILVYHSTSPMGWVAGIITISLISKLKNEQPESFTSG